MRFSHVFFVVCLFPFFRCLFAFCCVASFSLFFCCFSLFRFGAFRGRLVFAFLFVCCLFICFFAFWICNVFFFFYVFICFLDVLFCWFCFFICFLDVRCCCFCILLMCFVAFCMFGKTIRVMRSGFVNANLKELPAVKMTSYYIKLLHLHAIATPQTAEKERQMMDLHGPCRSATQKRNRSRSDSEVAACEVPESTIRLNDTSLRTRIRPSPPP